MRIISLRNLHLGHRWLGIVFGVLVLAWFISGLVMLYVPYPSLTQTERLSYLSPVDAQMVKFSVADIWSKQNITHPEVLKLAMLNNRPVYHFLMLDQQWQSIWADSGQKVLVEQELLRASVNDFNVSARVKDLAQVERDQWSLSARLDAHRPLYLAELDDSIGTNLYLSGRTGEVVVDTTKHERAWNWVGAVIHWIYFTPLRVEADLWRQIILWTSFFSMLLVGIGFWLGINRLRIKKTYKNKRITPYTGWKKWHHIIGLIGGIFCMTWLLSGWLSVKPFNWISERNISEQENLLWAGKPLSTSNMTLPTQFQSDLNFKEINWINFAGNTYVLGREENRDWLIDKNTGQVVKPFSHDILIKQAELLQMGHTIHSITELKNGDLYYRASHNKKILPVLRIAFNDKHRTSYYVDVNTSNIVASYDDRSRIYRWLYHGLHLLDIPPLSNFELSRQVVIFALSALGIVLSLAGVMIGIQRLRHL